MRVTEELREQVAHRLRAQQQRMTPSRARLLAVLEGSGRPLTIPEILERHRGLAQSSVYRNLVVLEDAGVVHRLVLHGEFARYELAEDLTVHHHHLVCSRCGRVEDAPASDAIERSVARAASQAAVQAGFRAEHHRLDLIGTCAACAS